MKNYAAVILAGGRAPWLKPFAGTDVRSLAKIHEHYLIEYILQALRESDCVEKIYVVSDSACLAALAAAGINGFTPIPCNKPTLAEVGLTAADAVEADKPDNHKILFVCDDIPLLTGEAVQSFLQQCEASPESEIFYTIISKETCEQQFPHCRRTYASLAEGKFTGGNVTLMTRAAIAKTQDVARFLFANRKHPLKLCTMLGWWFVLKAVCRCLTVAAVEKRCRELMDVKCKAIITEHASIGMDMDKQADWELMNQLLHS